METNEILILANLGLILFFICYCTNLIKNFNDKQDKLYFLFLYYDPQRKFFDIEYISNLFKKQVINKTFPRKSDEDYTITANRKIYKNLEFCTAELLINHLIEYLYFKKQNNKGSSDYYKVKIKVSFNQILENYSKCFDEPEMYNYLLFLGERIIINLLHIEGDIFNLYKVLKEITSKSKLYNICFINGVDNLIEKDRILYNSYPIIKINKIEIYNLYKQNFKKIDVY